MSWDGSLKATPVKEKWRRQCQLAFASQFLNEENEKELPKDMSDASETNPTTEALATEYKSCLPQEGGAPSVSEIPPPSSEKSESSTSHRRVLTLSSVGEKSL